MTSSAHDARPPLPTATPHDAPPTEVSDAPGARLGEQGLQPVSPKLVPARYLAGIPGYVIGVLLTIGAIVAADRKSTRLNSSYHQVSRMPSSA